MTRTVIFHEGEQTFHTGVLVAKGALKLPEGWPADKPVPVVINFVPSMVVAFARHMERDDDGRVSFELDWLTDRFQKIYSDWDVSFYTMPNIEKFDPELNRRVVTQATIRGISFYDPTSDDMGRSLPV